MRRSILFPSRFLTIPQITSGSPPAANQNQPYSFQFTEAGGTYPFTWSAVITPNTGGAFSINPVTGVLSGTQTVVETETVTVTVSDAMTPHNTASATYTIPVNSGVLITTFSLPNGVVSVPYSTTLGCTGGTPPYTWGMSPTSIDGLTLSTGGVLAGTPSSATTVSATFTATDSLGIPSAPVSLSFTATSAAGIAPPDVVYRGTVQSNVLMIAWNPPESGPWPDSYNVYRNGVQVATGVISKSNGLYNPQWFFSDATVSPSTTYQYTVTSVVGTAEGPASSPLSVTTLAALATTPTPPTPPTSYVPPAFSVPTGGTTYNVTPAGTGTASLAGALAAAVAGDVILVGLGTYSAPSAAFQLTPKSGPGWVYVMSANWASLPQPGTRVSPSDAANMPTIYNTSGSHQAFQMQGGSLFYRFVGLNITSPPNVGNNPQRATSILIVGGAACDHFAVDRCLFGTAANTNGFVWCTQGMGSINCDFLSVEDSFFHPFYQGGGPDAYGLGITAGGPGYIRNNYLQGVSEGILFGGTQNQVAARVVHDFTVFDNFGIKDPAWSWEVTGFMDDGTGNGVPSGSAGSVLTVTAITRSASAAPIFIGHACQSLGNVPSGTTTLVPNGAIITSQITGTPNGIGRYQCSMPANSPAVLCPSGTVCCAISNEVKNFFECKAGIRMEFYNNTSINNYNAGAGSQQGRAYVMNSRWAAVDYSAVGTLTGRIDNGTPGTAGNVLTITGTPSAFYTFGRGSYVKSTTAGLIADPTWIFDFGTGTGGLGTYIVTGPPQNVAATAIKVAPTYPKSQLYWTTVTDINIHDNDTQGVGSLGYFFSDINFNAAYIERCRVVNNRVWVSPQGGRDTSQGLTQAHGMQIQGPCPDLIIDNNTWIIDSANTGYSNPGSLDCINFTQQSKGLGGPVMATDRLSVTDNAVDGAAVVRGFNVTGGSLTQTDFACLAISATNAVWKNNVAVKSTTNFNQTSGSVSGSGNATVSGVYANLGMANFVNAQTAPANLTAWNIVNAPYSTASTTGGPVGAFFAFDPVGLFLGNSLQGISLQIPSSSGSFGSGQWIAYAGTDTKYGNGQAAATNPGILPRSPVSPWGGSATFPDQVQQIYGTLGTSQADIAESIATDNTVPVGVSTRVAVETLITAYNSSLVNQDSYIVHPNITLPQGMLYTSRWVWLQADLASRVGGGFNQEVCETKTPDGSGVAGTFQGPDRLQMNIVISTGTPWGLTAPACFNFTHSTEISNSGPISQQSNTWVAPDATHASGGYTAGITYSPVAVPLGRWFRVEWAFNRLDSTGQGWMWCAITDPGSSDPNLRAGIQIFAARGPFTFVDPWGSGTWTCGMNPTPGISGHQPAKPYYDRIFLNNLSYGGIVRGGASGNYVIKWTDMQVYARWPASATAHPSNYL